jgi:predicted transcriptional regulator
VIVEDVDTKNDNARIVFYASKAEAAMYGAYKNQDYLHTDVVKGGNKIKMSKEILTKEIIKLFSKKEKYALREIAYKLGQSISHVKNNIHSVCVGDRIGNKHLYMLKPELRGEIGGVIN